MSENGYGAKIPGIITAGTKIQGAVTTGQMVVNDWVITMQQTAEGGIITARRGTDVQTLTLKHGGGSGGGGAASHGSLAGRDLPDQHPISAITGLEDALEGKQPKGNYALRSEIPTVPTKVSAFDNDAGYLTEHQDLSEYARKSDIPDIPTTVSSFENDAGYLTAPATASVGQTVVVKAVDESGKPTEWEAADMQSGGGGGVTLWEYSEETFQPSSSGSSFYYIPAEISSFKWVEVVFRIPALYGRSATRFVVVRHLVSDLLVANPDNPFQTPEILLKTVTEAKQNYFTLVTAVLQYSGDKFVFDEENQFEYKYAISSGSISVTKNNSYSVGVVPFKIVGYYE